MIRENREPRDEQTTAIIPSTSTINQAIQQLTTINNTQSIISNEWKQIPLQGLNVTPQETKLKIASQPFYSTKQQVKSFYSH